MLPFAEREGIGVIVYSPMSSGLLTGKMTRERIEHFPDDDWRKQDERFREPQLSEHLATTDRVSALADRLGVSPGAVAIAWTLRNPAVDGAIVGLRRPDQVDELIDGAPGSSSQTSMLLSWKGPTMTTIGFVGLGAMGGRMAARLLASGNDVIRHQPKQEQG